ncbi:LCP family protein [Marisediminicola sp. LYQ134]|uniref:LCP family protein n=1 Tax=Marisediminicola sp. LYQ134 TaxID=3391061 RepID=UPI003982F3E5
MTRTTPPAPTPDRAAPIARHGMLRTSRGASAVVRVIAMAAAVLLVATVSVTAITAARLAGNVETVALPGEDAAAPVVGLGAFEGGFDMLIVGSDECVDTGGCPDRTEKLNDFTMLLHVADDQQSAVAVTFPRDLIVPIPPCPREDGSGTYNAMSAQQINVTLTYGGLPCTALTVTALTGVEIPYGAIMTFEGVRQISSAIGGVDVCIDAPIFDPFSGLDLPTAGLHSVEGEQALQFLRTRHGIGDGSDTGRIGAQQSFLSSMMRKIKSEETLTDFTKVFSLADAASRNMTVSENLKNVNTLAAMALVFRDIPLENITFVKYPAAPGIDNPSRVFPITSSADALFERIAAGLPVGLDSGAVGVVEPPSPETPADPESPGSPEDPSTPAAPDTEEPIPDASASPSPDPSPSGGSPTDPVTDPEDVPIAGATGQTAAQETCAKANG